MTDIKSIDAIIFDWRGTLVDRDYTVFNASHTTLVTLKQRGYKLGLISVSKDTNGRRDIISKSGLEYLFDLIIVDTIKTVEHFSKCISSLGATPKTTAVVDDRTVRGIKEGNTLGCTTFWVQSGKYKNELPNEKTGKPTHSINAVQDLIKYL